MSRRTVHHPGHKTGGQAMVEFVIILVPLLLLVMGILQFGLIYQAKVTLNYAAFETARTGSVTGARMYFMEQAFARAMAPLYTNGFINTQDCTSNYFIDLNAQRKADATFARTLEDTGAFSGLSVDHLKCGRQRVRDKITAGEARILLVSPSQSSFDDFGVDYELVGEMNPTTDSHLLGTRTIPNDNLMYRSSATGALSGQSIHDANLIQVHVNYCADMVVPFVSQVLSGILQTSASLGDFGRNCTTAFGGMPIFSQATMRMQSAAIEGTTCVGFCP